VRKSRWFFDDGLLTNEGESWLRRGGWRSRVSSRAHRVLRENHDDYARADALTWRDGETRDIHKNDAADHCALWCAAVLMLRPSTRKFPGHEFLMRNTTGVRMLLPPRFAICQPAMIESGAQCGKWTERL